VTILNQAPYLNIILPLPLAGTFTYKLKDKITDPEKLVGCRVIVPFGRSKIYTGVVSSISSQEATNSQYTIRTVLDILDETPILLPVQLEFMRWISEYYMCTVGEVFNAALPSHLKLTSDAYVGLFPDINPYDLDLNGKEEQLVQLLSSGELTINEIKKQISLSYPQRIIKSLTEKNIVYLYEKVKDKYSPKTERRIRLNKEWISEEKLNELQELLIGKKKQLDVLVAYLGLVDLFSYPNLNQKGIDKKELGTSISKSSLNTLIKKGFFEEWNEKIDRFNYQIDSLVELPELTEYQLQKFNLIVKSFETKSTVLLKGITGSGKTELYMRLIKEQLDNGNQALLLLPEIALTTQIIDRFRKVFGNQFGVYHSRFSDNERAEIYQDFLDGKYHFVIGVRSSIFLPFDQLGLIIIDEEHEFSYKQYDPAPRYHARDAAIYLAHLHQAKVLLGSATPSLESYKNAQDEKYGYFVMDRRYGDQPLPQIQTIDLKQARHRKQVKGHFSHDLLEQIQLTLSNNKQVILFQNQRGYSPFIQCAKCAHVPKCPNCAVSLTYHIYQNQLICHYCGYKQFMDNSCSSCGEEALKTMGSGTEKIEEELELILPDRRIKRMDLDTTRSKNAYQDIIDDFAAGKIDVLIGTQMVTKGLDFEHVHLVGVFDADRMIHFPDFRSHERAFQLITQVSGRSGRKHERGLVMIQTSDPSQPIIQHIKEGHLDLFYQQELQERENFKYPPFHRVIKIIFRHKEPKTANNASLRYYTLIRNTLGDQRILGPIEPTINKIRNYYIFEIWIKLEKNVSNLTAIKQFLNGTNDSLLALPEFKSVLVHFDVDPV
jgi:primosomal protein N' (replication factor Y)